MKSILIFLLLIKSLCFYSQSDMDITLLEEKKQQLNIRILKIKDSINSIELKITKAKSKKFLDKISDSSMLAIVKTGAQLRKQPNVISDIIIIFKDDNEITIIDYRNNYFEVCYKSICGYINEVSIEKTEEISNFIESKRIEKKIAQKKRSSAINYTSQLKSKTRKKTSNKSVKYKTTRSYYRGPRGGCYYINSNGNKTYVARSLCN